MSKKGQPGKRKKGNSHGNSRRSNAGTTGNPAPGGSPSRPSIPIRALTPSSSIQPSQVFAPPPVARLALPSALELAERLDRADRDSAVGVALQLQPDAYSESYPDEDSDPEASDAAEASVCRRTDSDKDESGPRIVAHLVPLVVPAPTQAAPQAPALQTGSADTPSVTEKVVTERALTSSISAISASLEPFDRDDVSIPPHVQSLTAELDDAFFEEGEKAHEAEPARRAALVADLALEAESDPHSHKMTPAVRARRARFAKYVKAAVGFSVLVCAAALVRGAVARGSASAASLAAPESVAAAILPASAPPSERMPLAPEPTATPVAVVEPAPLAIAPAPGSGAEPVATAAAPGAPLAPEAVPAGSGAVAPSDTPPKTFAEEKRASRQALERGNAKLAIEAGERAVTLDPTDGDAWLVLGAAYQEKGKLADARRCFASCVKEGKKGPVGECSAMLRQ